MPEPLRVLVTGAAGLIGGELCGALIERGHRVMALVHRRQRIVRCDETILRTSEGDPPVGGVGIWRGDVRAPDLGLAGDAPALLAGCDRVIHCAADTTLAGSGHAAVNVDGTAHVAALLARLPSAPGLVHVSTAYVCGARSGPIAETPSVSAGTNAYEISKLAAERAVTASGSAAAIARPSIVVGRWYDGVIARFENIYGLLKLVGEGRIRELPAAADATLDLVPIDHVVGGLVDIVENFDRAKGKISISRPATPSPCERYAR